MDPSPPHVVIIPFPAQGHIKPMLILAELLSRAGITITFINTEHSHKQLVTNKPIADESSCIKFLSIPDGLDPDHPRSGPHVVDLFSSLSNIGKTVLKSLIVSTTSHDHEPVCMIICDGIMSFAIDVADELEIRAVTFRTFSATATWTYFFLDKLVQEGHVPVREGSHEDMDHLVSCIPGLEDIMRRRDLPSICRLGLEDHLLRFFMNQTSKMRKATALILNTFEELEAPIISLLHSIFPTVYAVGPLHAALRSSTLRSASHSSSSLMQLMQFDKSCIEWLDSQLPKSVLYVSFGSVIVLSREQLMEFWYGLVNSGTPFLWAIRPDLIWEETGPSGVPEELKMGTEERGRIVGWAPQEDVLAHSAIGAFLTHSGWNSTLESVSAGKPMICWPRIVDQLVNSRCVSEMWKVGIDMKDTCDRSTVEKMVRELMEGRREDIVKSTDETAKLARDSIRDGGSSNRNIKKLVEDIKLLHATNSAFMDNN